MKFTLNFIAESGEIIELTVLRSHLNAFNIDTNTLHLRRDEYSQFEAMTGDPKRKAFIAKIPKFSNREIL